MCGLNGPTGLDRTITAVVTMGTLHTQQGVKGTSYTLVEGN